MKANIHRAFNILRSIRPHDFLKTYAAMNAGKSTILLQASHNDRERGMQTLLFTSALYADDPAGAISSRLGVASNAAPYSASDDLYASIAADHAQRVVDCVFVDEAQFLSPEQVWQRARVADRSKIPVLCYGLRTDFRGKLFPGSADLLAIADCFRVPHDLPLRREGHDVGPPRSGRRRQDGRRADRYREVGA